MNPPSPADPYTETVTLLSELAADFPLPAQIFIALSDDHIVGAHPIPTSAILAVALLPPSFAPVIAPSLRALWGDHISNQQANQLIWLGSQPQELPCALSISLNLAVMPCGDIRATMNGLDIWCVDRVWSVWTPRFRVECQGLGHCLRVVAEISNAPLN